MHRNPWDRWGHHYGSAGWPGFWPFGGQGRFFESGQARLAILSMLEDGPKHGYEIIKELVARSGGLYRASAGTVYPTLQLLEDQDLVASEQQDGKKVYRLTDLGRRELDREAEAVKHIWRRAARWEDWSKWMGPEAALMMGPLGALMKATFQAVASAGHDPDRSRQVQEILDGARKAMDGLLADDRR